MDTHDESDVPQTGGPIAWMAGNSVAANLLMIIIVVAGLFGLLRAKQEVFPEFSTDTVLVAVPYPGASPEEVEQGIVLAVEEQVRGIDGVKKVTSTAAEGGGTVTVQLLLGADPDKALNDIKSAVDRIRSFPEEAERAEVRLVSNRVKVVTLIVSGDQDAQVLFDLAERARERLLEDPDVTQVELDGVRDLEVGIEIPRQTLQSLGLTLDDVAMQIRAASLELPGGSVKTEAGEVLVRVADRRLRGNEFENIVIRATADGSLVRLGDVAEVTDGFAEQDLYPYFNGRPAVKVVAYRVGAETPRGVSQAVHRVKHELEGELPEGITLSIWDDDSKMLDERIELLTSNAQMGLVLVFLVLTAFLELRLAFWVALGIPISFLGAFFLMPLAGVSINMITLFAFIVTLGMVVDDAIIVGENIHEYRKQGMSPMGAAVRGAQEMAVPVTFSILTTVAAFSPLLFVPGFMGKLFGLMPTIVILVLVFSLIESFFILPAHLGHELDLPRIELLERFVTGPIARGQAWISGWLDTFIERIYKPGVEHVIHWRYFAACAALALFVFTLGLMASGAVPFSFFPKLEGDLARVKVRLPYGAPVEQTERVRTLLEESLAETVAQFGGADAIAEGQYTIVGQGPPGWGGRQPDTGSHVLTVEIQMVSASERDFNSAEFVDAWQANTPDIAGVEALIFDASTGPAAGAAVDAEISHPSQEVRAQASAELANILLTYPSLTNTVNSWASGKPQLDYSLKPEARTLGITGNDLARQLRSGFFGAEALREQRGRHELKVMVRLPREQRGSEYDLEQLHVRTPVGQSVPLGQVADLERGRAPTDIGRVDGRRVVNVTADLAPGVKSSGDVLASLKDEVFPKLREKYPGLEVQLVGEQQEQAEVFTALGLNYLLALFVMFTLLAVPFKSYIQPAVVMAAIPMGMVGAVFGHLVMGYEMSIISMFGVVALSGVVVNDSLVLIDATNGYRRDGMTAHDAIIQGGTRRLRPILLTSLTTFFGLAPMILETSMQARFLIPMAISLGFGVLFATVIILVLVPALYMIVEDISWFVGWILTPDRPADADSDPQGPPGSDEGDSLAPPAGAPV